MNRNSTLTIITILIFLLSTSVCQAQQRYVGAFGEFEIKEDRPNIAEAKNKMFEYSNPEDFFVRDLAFFVPKQQVVIHKVTIRVEEVSLNERDFFLGDNCLYIDTGTGDSEYQIPLATEIHCTGTSVWNQNGYERSISFENEEYGFIVDIGNRFDCPVHIALISPNILQKSEVATAKVICEIFYTIPDKEQTLYKFIRIPYLDQYPDAPNLIKPDRKWYKNWPDETVLEVVGLSLYHNPKPFRDQILKDVCIYVIGVDGIKKDNSEVCYPEQLYIAGQTHLQYEPSFLSGKISVSKGEYLSGTCNLHKGNNAADCVLYVLIKIPSHLEKLVKATPLYYSSGIVNMDYLKGDYCYKDIFTERLTPFGRRSINNIGITEMELWKKLREQETEIDFDGLNSFYCSLIFID